MRPAKASPFGRGVCAADGEGKPGTKEHLHSDKHWLLIESSYRCVFVLSQRPCPLRRSAPAPQRGATGVSVGLPFVQPLSLTPFDSSPSRGASGETVHFAGTAKASPTRGGGSASALTERLSPAAAHGGASLRINLSVSLRSTAPLVGEPLAKPFTLRGLPKPLPLGEVASRKR